MRDCNWAVILAPFRHSCTRYPIPAFAGTSFAGTSSTGI